MQVAFTAPVNRHGDDRTLQRSALSQQLWGIDWNRHLPLDLRGFSVSLSSYEGLSPFIAKYYPTLFEEDTSAQAFGSGQSHPAKARYYRAAGDFFEFVADGETVGVVIGTPIDWSSYYIRTAALLPQFQGRQPIQHFFSQCVFDVLREAGVERVELDVAPSNLAMMHVVTRLRFNATGTLLTERWGAHVHFTKFLREDAERVFIAQFCSGPKYQLRNSQAMETSPSETR